MSEIITDKLTGKTSAGDVTITSEGGAATFQLQQGLAKAWFQDETLANNATTTAEDSFNISGYTDTATGQLTPAFSSNFSNTGYSSVAVNCTSSATNALTKYNASTSGETVLMYHQGNAAFHDVGVCAVYKGDLA